MLHRLLLSTFIALGVTATTIVSASAQPVVGDASALTARIASYHRGPGRWTGVTPPPPLRNWSGPGSGPDAPGRDWPATVSLAPRVPGSGSCPSRQPT